MRGMSQARIDNKGHAPCYQFLNSSFILQYRTLENLEIINNFIDMSGI